MKPIWTRMRPVNFCVKILLIGYFFSPWLDHPDCWRKGGDSPPYQ
jgi:hypothetical protein